MRTIHIMSGLPASGKSTYCEKCGQLNGDVVIHRDQVRAILREDLGSTEYFPCSADKEYEFFVQYVVDKIRNTDKDVWVDQTTLSTGSALKLLYALDKFIDWNDFIIRFEVMQTPVEVCIARDNDRSGFEHVGEERIRDMAKGFNISFFNIARKTPPRMSVHMNMAHHQYKEEKHE